MRASADGLRVLGLAWLLLVTTASADSPDLGELRDRGSLRALVTSEEYVEWFALKDSESPGFERELLKDFARLNRLNLEVVVLEDFDALIPALLAGKGNVIPSLNDTPARRKKIAFTVEVLPMHHVAVSRKPQTAPRTLEELKRRKVAVVAGTTWADVTRAHVPAAQIVGFERTDQAMAALRAGTVSAIVIAVSEYIWQRQRDPELEPGVLVGERLSAAWVSVPRTASCATLSTTTCASRSSRRAQVKQARFARQHPSSGTFRTRLPRRFATPIARRPVATGPCRPRAFRRRTPSSGDAHQPVGAALEALLRSAGAARSATAPRVPPGRAHPRAWPRAA